jgi:N-formylglutamate amidohydrolase
LTDTTRKVEPIPLVFDSPHSGEHYPDDFDHLPPREEVRGAEDTHVARLYRQAPAFGATLIAANFPRAYIDPNRSLADIDLTLLADAWHAPIAPSRKTALGIGLVWRIVRGGVSIVRWLPRLAHSHSPYGSCRSLCADCADSPEFDPRSPPGSWNVAFRARVTRKLLSPQPSR